MKTSRYFILIFLAALFFTSSCKSIVDPPADRNNDGVPDAQDDCPNTPGDREYNGCPWWKVDVCSGNAPHSHHANKWSNLNPGFRFSSSLPAAWRNESEYAASTWNQVDSRPQIFVNRTIVNEGVGLDNKNVVSYGPLESSVLGRTYGWYNPSTGAVVEADIRISANASLNIGGLSTTYDVRSVLVHEFGHFCGLNHVSDRTHTMYPDLHVDSIVCRTLCAGDKLGLLRLY